MSTPAEISLQLQPRTRFDVIDVTKELSNVAANFLAHHKRTLYCSHHTTAGYLEQSLCSRFDHSHERLQSFIQTFQKLFPPGADYEHDKMHLRRDLTPEQKLNEPLNADSHLTFIGSGLENCVTYVNRAEYPVYFIDLDGVNGEAARERKTTVIGFEREEFVTQVEIPISVSDHPIDSISLKNPQVGLFDQIEELLRHHEITKGRVDLAVMGDERHTGLTVNEYETMLMQNDLVEVLENPLRFMAEKGRNMIRDPRAIPVKTLGYAQYDLVHVLNELMDALRMSESLLEKIVTRFMAFPAERFLRMKSSVSMLVSDHQDEGNGEIVLGTYQSPILVQWRKSPTRTRRLKATLTRFV